MWTLGDPVTNMHASRPSPWWMAMLLSALFVVACSFDPGLSADDFVQCGEEGDCPSGSACIVAQKRCVPANSACVVGEGGEVAAAENGTSCGAGNICLDGLCVAESCGDGFVSEEEECDDGLQNSDSEPNACRTTCELAQCGDGVVDDDERCDDGEGNSATNADACRPGCTLPRCGDGVRDGSEVCDDGNTVSGDGCRGTCDKIEACGDGVVDDGQQCDDANANDLDLCGQCRLYTWEPEIVGGLGTDGGDPQRTIIGPTAVAVDRSGNLYASDLLTSTIVRLDAAGQRVTRLAGTARITSVVQPGPAGARATDVNVTGVFALHVSPAGDLITADLDESVVRRIDVQTGRMFNVAGTGVAGSSGDGGPGTLAAIGDPRDVATDGNGNILITDFTGSRVRRVDRDTGIITTIAGNGRQATGSTVDDGDGGDPLRARVSPLSLDVDASGTVWIWDLRNILRRVVVDPVDRRRFVRIERVLAFENPGDSMESLAVAADGRTAWVTNRSVATIFEFDLVARTTRVIAGSGELGFNGDAADATRVNLDRPTDVVYFNENTLFIAETQNGRLRRLDRNVDGTWASTTVLGTGLAGGSELIGYLAPRVLQASGGGLGLRPRPDCSERVDIVLAQTSLRQVFFQDACNGALRLVAGSGARGLSGDDGPALLATFVEPLGTAIDPLGNIFVADPGAHVVRRIGVDGIITRVAGTGVAGFSGDGGQATAATLNRPAGVAVDDRGRIVIADTGNHRLRRVDPTTGVITTLIGTGVEAPGVDGTNLAEQTVASPKAIVFLPASLVQAGATGGLLFFVERTGHRVRALLDMTLPNVPAALLPPQTTTLAGDGTAGYVDDADGLRARLDHPRAVGGFVDDTCPRGCILVLDGVDRVRRLTLGLGAGFRLVAGVTTDVGGAIPVDDGPLGDARFPGPVALAPFGADAALVSDRVTGRLRRIDFSAARIDTVAGLPDGIEPGESPVSALRARPFLDPAGIAVDEQATPKQIFVAERGSHMIRRVVAVDEADPATWTTDVMCGRTASPGHLDGTCADARFDGPAGLAFDATRRALFVADQENHVVRRIDFDADRVVTLVGQVGVRGVLVDDVAGPDALLDTPSALVVVGEALFVADAGLNRVIRVDDAFADDVATTRVHPVLGDGVAASSGDGSPAAFFTVDTPEALAADAAGNLFVASQQTVRFVAAGDDEADGADAVASVYGAPPRARFPEPVTKCINGVTHLPSGDVLVVDRCVGLLIRLRRQGL